MRSAGAEELDTLQSPVEITLKEHLNILDLMKCLITPDSIRMKTK